MRSSPLRIHVMSAALGVAGAIASSMALAAAGKVLLVSGAGAIDGPNARLLRSGDALDVGDVVATAPGTRAQLLMADGARIILQPGTSLRIDEFAMPSAVREPGATGSSASPGKSVATLLSGRIEASAGAIGSLIVHAHGERFTVTRAHIGFVEAAVPIGALPTADDAAPPQLAMSAHSRLGLGVNLLEARMPLLPKVSTAIALPTSAQPAPVFSTTEPSDTVYYSNGGSVVQLNSLIGSGAAPDAATYLSGTAAMVDFGRNGSSGIRWGRWTTGIASIATLDGSHPVNLQSTSLHWIAGPTFEATPVLPTSGSIPFTLAGGTSPTDSLGHAGTLAAGIFTADFTAQKVSAQLSLDVNGYNWFASGSGALTAKTVLFHGTFGTVLVDGRVSGTGTFSGFFSAGPLTPDQLNGAGLSYSLTSSEGGLGTVAGVAAFVPGSVVPLVPPLVQRDVAYTVGSLLPTDLAGGTAANSNTALALDSNGNLARFSASLGFAIGTARNVNTGFDAVTGIRWGRWQGGAIGVTMPPARTRPYDTTSQSLHWIAGNEYGAPPDLPLTGTATYTLTGYTDPTDTSGHVGSLGSASLNADFTNRLVHSTLTVNIDGRAWYARGDATFPLGSERFTGTYTDVRIDNLASGHGTIDGFFTQPRVSSGSAEGAGVAFNLTDDAHELGSVSGVLAFGKGGSGGVVAPPITQQRDVAVVSPDVATGGTFVARASPADYTLNSSFALESMPGTSNTGARASYGLGSSAVADSSASSLVMLRWGRWAGGAAVVTNPADHSTYTVDLSRRSLHWIEGADSDAPPVIPQSGVATYALIGATSPTDRAGHTGSLNKASLSADFTHQTVNALLNVTVNKVNIVANGNGVIGAGAGLPAHQFSGAITGGVASSTQAAPQGSFSGFFSAAGGTQGGVPGGAGLTYTLTDAHGVTIDGAAAFHHP